MDWTSREDELLRKLYLANISFDTICKNIPNKSRIEIQARIDRFGLEEERNMNVKGKHKITVKVLQRELDKINAKRDNQFVGSYRIIKSEYGYGIVQMINSRGDTSILCYEVSKAECLQCILDIKELEHIEN